MSADIDLLPCAHCGGAAQVDDHHDDRDNRVIECVDCGACVGANMLDEGVKRWNRRATPSPAPIPEGQAERLLGEKLRCEFTSGTVTRDFGGPKITLRYKTQAATERAFAAVADLVYATPPAAPKEPT